jgi:hypothetical protein
MRNIRVCRRIGLHTRERQLLQTHMARDSRKYRPGIDDPPQPTVITRAVHWAFAEALRLVALIFKRRSQ